MRILNLLRAEVSHFFVSEQAQASARKQLAKGIVPGLAQMVERHPEFKVDLHSFRPHVGREGMRTWSELAPSCFDVGTRYLKELRHGFLEPLKRLIDQEILIDQSFSIHDVVMIAASKSDLHKFPTIEDFENRQPNEQHQKGFEACLDWGEIRCIRGQGSSSCDFFLMNEWDGRLMLENAGGSHHFSALRRLSRELSKPVELEGRYVKRRLNREAVSDLRRGVQLLAMTEEGVKSLRPLLSAHISKGIVILRAPRFFGNTWVLALDIEKTLPKAAGAFLLKHGYQDLGNVLSADLQAQLQRGVIDASVVDENSSSSWSQAH